MIRCKLKKRGKVGKIKQQQRVGGGGGGGLLPAHTMRFPQDEESCLVQGHLIAHTWSLEWRKGPVWPHTSLQLLVLFWSLRLALSALFCSVVNWPSSLTR